MSALASRIDLDPAMILAAAAELRENAIKDKTYQQTPLGRLVARYLSQLAFDNYSPKTIDVREQILAHLALDLAHVDIDDITPERLREHLAERFGNLAVNTRATASSTVRVFFQWAEDEELIERSPARRLRSPRQSDTTRQAHTLDTIRRLIVEQDQRRDRVAILLLYWCALRRNELRLIQWRHIDLARRLITVQGKGRRILEQNIPEPVALEVERYVLDEACQPDEFLLYPQKVGRRGRWPFYIDEVIWENRKAPLSLSGIDSWWRRRVTAAGLDHFPMHEVRHTAATHFHLSGHDLVATQHFLRHKNPATTARVYVHTDRQREIARVQREMTDPLDQLHTPKGHTD